MKRFALKILLDSNCWVGCIAGLIGSALLALHFSYSGFGFVLYLISNAFMLAYGIRTRVPGIVVMQIGFTITSVIGIKNWLM